jgi:hypothetical protein
MAGFLKLGLAFLIGWCIFGIVTGKKTPFTEAPPRQCILF